MKVLITLLARSRDPPKQHATRIPVRLGILVRGGEGLVEILPQGNPCRIFKPYTLNPKP